MATVRGYYDEKSSSDGGQGAERARGQGRDTDCRRREEYAVCFESCGGDKIMSYKMDKPEGYSRFAETFDGNRDTKPREKSVSKHRRNINVWQHSFF